MLIIKHGPKNIGKIIFIGTSVPILIVGCCKPKHNNRYKYLYKYWFFESESYVNNVPPSEYDIIIPVSILERLE